MSDINSQVRVENYERQNAIYALSSLVDILAKEPMIPIIPEFLQTIQGATKISPQNRQELFLWMLDISSKSSLNVETLQKGFCYVDIMLSSLSFSQDALYLIGISSLILASKINESQDFSYQFYLKILSQICQMKNFAEAGISQNEIVKCESGILQFCQWRPMVPTSTEILKLLLFITNTSQDFTEIIERTNEYIFSSLLEYEISSRFRYSSIAVACLILVLEELNFENFLDGILHLVQEYEIPFDFNQIQDCKQMLVRLINNAQDQDLLLQGDDSHFSHQQQHNQIQNQQYQDQISSMTNERFNVSSDNSNYDLTSQNQQIRPSQMQYIQLDCQDELQSLSLRETQEATQQLEDVRIQNQEQFDNSSIGSSCEGDDTHFNQEDFFAYSEETADTENSKEQKTKLIKKFKKYSSMKKKRQATRKSSRMLLNLAEQQQLIKSCEIDFQDESFALRSNSNKFLTMGAIETTQKIECWVIDEEFNSLQDQFK